ncbi:hypothetical protein [Frigidibacter sp. SD6-1]|uniref:hypothetical protein n=1 Tax=Frigidibacter sp. SD6-1 TaxID=3032581 RepID=UPI0024DFC4E6|nr:hypothetical protein [Frigidibacter sp. SD6-1]
MKKGIFGGINLRDLVETLKIAVLKPFIYLFAIIFIGLPMLPIAIYKAVKARTAVKQRILRPKLSDPRYSHRITTRVVHRVAQDECMAEVARQVTTAYEQSDWRGLARMIEGWDRTRAHAPHGNRLAHVALEGLGELAGNDPEVIKEIDAALHIAPQAYGLAAMAAHLHMQMGWAYRGTDWARNVDALQWAGMHKSFNRARKILSAYEPTEYDSPLLASLPAGALAGADNAAQAVVPIFRKWVDLDPGDEAAYSSAANFLMPRWCGSHAAHEAEAQRAASLYGPASYALFYLGSLRCEPLLLGHIDTALFARGVMALVERAENCPAYSAWLVQEIYPVANTSFGTPEKRAALHMLVCDLMRNHMNAIVPDYWQGGEAVALWFLSEAVADDIDAGAHFRFGEKGIEAYWAAEPEPTLA